MWEPDLVTSTSGRREGVAAAAPDGVAVGPQAIRDAFRMTVQPAAAYISVQPSPNLMRAAARRISIAVLQIGNDLAHAHEDAEGR
jgi:hypothetical protein